MKIKTLKFIAIVIVVALVITIAGVYVQIQRKTRDTQEKLLKIAYMIVNKSSENELTEEFQKQEIESKEFKLNKDVIGILKIPKLNIEAPIKEGTSQDVLKYAIGHFENSGFWNGNVAIAAHNQGMYTQYFQKINKLVKGDEISYITKLGTRQYKVNEIKKINSKDWSVISDKEQNVITLITCIKNQENYRLCVRGESL